MRHHKKGRKLGRTSPHRKALFSNMVTSLIMHERIETTEAKAKELRHIAEKAINWSAKVAHLTAKGTENLSLDERSKVVHAMRMAGRTVKNKEALLHLFHEVGPRFKERPGGYTRVLKTRNRVGDCAPMAFIELTERASN